MKIRQIAGLDFPTGFQNYGALDYVAQFTDVARPMMRQQLLLGRRRKLFNVLVHRGAELPQEMLRQQENIVASFAQRRRRKLHHIQPVKQILPKLVLANRVNDVPVRCGNQPYVHAQFLIPANACEAAVLQEAEQLGLQWPAHIANLIQKNRSSMRFLNPSKLLLERPGKRAAFMAK